MKSMKCFLFFFTLLLSTAQIFASDKFGEIERNLPKKTITITTADKSLVLVIDYNEGCLVKELRVKGKNVLSNGGIESGIILSSGTFTAFNASSKIKVSETPTSIKISGIEYGDSQLKVTEDWDFKLAGNAINWNITREYSTDAFLKDSYFPRWNFADLNVWKGGILDNGGMVWCKYLKKMDDTYGVHTGGATFWNAESGDALRISPSFQKDQHIASKFSHSTDGVFSFTQILADKALDQEYNLSRFVSGKSNVFAPFKVKKGKTSTSLKIEYIDYFKEYSRGNLPGIDSLSVRELLNTTGRYGVVDNNIVGANGWLTNWKCLHEPFFAQIGMALDDPNYERNMASTLDQERDQAMLADGRVLSRWHDIPGDEIKGTYNPKTGYYEAMWGYTVDSQTGYVINASEQFDLSGDVNWLRTHKSHCEKALDWLIRRDSNKNGIFEMVNTSIKQKTASDWLDIVWASYENAFVNAQMYEALTLWSACEKTLGDGQKSEYYAKLAERLKIAFNKPIEQGGFWDEDKAQYVYWRDQDGSVHGDNLVTPVNFAAIAFGLCDDPHRIAQVLNQIEKRALAENLFHWPLCFDSFKQDEVSAGNWPFPKYENGDIFPSWGYLGVRAYAKYDNTIALKYIKNLLAQYKKDGLSSQRYSRETQLGLGDDVLAGICTSITALYRDIYGIRPKWNRMGIEPNLDKSLNGTQFNYLLRGKEYHFFLNVDGYQISGDRFSVHSNEAFGISKQGRVLKYFNQNEEKNILKIEASINIGINLDMLKWDADQIQATITSKGSYTVTITGLDASKHYKLLVDAVEHPSVLKSDGTISFKMNILEKSTFEVVKKS
ncbi:hypothetical protein ACVWYG_003502 [Pedobacter sp. UYEF25]